MYVNCHRPSSETFAEGEASCVGRCFWWEGERSLGYDGGLCGKHAWPGLEKFKVLLNQYWNFGTTLIHFYKIACQWSWIEYVVTFHGLITSSSDGTLRLLWIVNIVMLFLSKKFSSRNLHLYIKYGNRNRLLSNSANVFEANVGMCGVLFRRITVHSASKYAP